MLHGLIDKIINYYNGALSSGGYPLVALLMAIESSLCPLPSELVIPPAAHLAHSGKIPLSLTGLVIAGTIGSWVGAAIMYWASRLAGRPLVMRFGRYALISPEKVSGAEHWATHYGSMGVFISRLLPVVRHLIGIPMGIVRMDFRWYSLFTIAGSAIWCSVLCWVGVKMGEDQQLMNGEMHRVTLWLCGAMLGLGGIYYFFVYRQMKAKKA